jgi:hypothetical protein
MNATSECINQTSAIAEHCLEIDRKTEFGEATVVARSTRYTVRLVKSAIETRLHPSSFNRGGGFVLSRIWCRYINLLHKTNKAKQDSEGTGTGWERAEAGLSYTNREQLENDRRYVGPG